MKITLLSLAFALACFTAIPANAADETRRVTTTSTPTAADALTPAIAQNAAKPFARMGWNASTTAWVVGLAVLALAIAWLVYRGRTAHTQVNTIHPHGESPTRIAGRPS